MHLRIITSSMAERSTIKKEYSLRANSATRKDTVVVWIKEV